MTDRFPFNLIYVWIVWNYWNYVIIISLSQSMLDIGNSNCSRLSSIPGFSHPAPANRLKIIYYFTMLIKLAKNIFEYGSLLMIEFRFISSLYLCKMLLRCSHLNLFSFYVKNFCLHFTKSCCLKASSLRKFMKGIQRCYNSKLKY